MQVLLVDARAAAGLALLRRPGLGRDAVGSQIDGDLGRRADGQHLLEDATHHRRLGLVDDQQAVVDVVTQGRDAAHPHPFALGGGNLVADALAGNLALKLGEGQQDVEHQPVSCPSPPEMLMRPPQALRSLPSPEPLPPTTKPATKTPSN